MRRRRFRSFAKDTRGVAAIEFALLVPVLLVLLMGGVTTFLMTRDSRNAERATYTIADNLARDDRLGRAKLELAQGLLLSMTRAEAKNVRFRVASLRRIDDEFRIDWAWAKTGEAPLSRVEEVEAQLPLVADNDSVLMVEVAVISTPFSSFVHQPSMTFSYKTANRPRSVAFIPWQN